MSDVSPGVTRRQALVVALLFAGYAGYYVCRSNLSVCQTLIEAELVGSGLSAGLARSRMGLVISCGTLAYALGKFLGGGFTDRFGGRAAFLAGMAGSVACTALFAAGGGVPVFGLAWVGNRLIQSVGWLGLVRVTSRWFSFGSYGTVMGILSLSYLFGDAAARYFMKGLLAAGMGWRGVFFVAAGVLGALLLVCLAFLRDSPGAVGLPEPPAAPDNLFAGDDGPAASSRELAWTLLRSPGFRTVCLLSVGMTLLRETFNTWTPTYFVEALGLSKEAAAGRSALFPLLGGVSVVLTGVLGDRIGRVGRAGVIAGGLTLAGLALATLAATDFGGSVAWPVGVVSAVAFLLIGPYSFLAGAIALDFGGKKGCATASGLIDTAGYLGGVFAGYGVAKLSLTLGWRGAFGVLAVVAWLTAATAVVFLLGQRRVAGAARGAGS